MEKIMKKKVKNYDTYVCSLKIVLCISEEKGSYIQTKESIKPSECSSVAPNTKRQQTLRVLDVAFFPLIKM